MTRIVLDIDDTRWKIDHLARVMRSAQSEWLSELAAQVDTRAESPLIVLKGPDDAPTDHFPRLIRFLRGGGWDFTADQIEAQCKPARIPEPGLWGVVEASSLTYESRARYVHNDISSSHWVSLVGRGRAEWSNLIDPTLIREGVEP